MWRKFLEVKRTSVILQRLLKQWPCHWPGFQANSNKPKQRFPEEIWSDHRFSLSGTLWFTEWELLQRVSVDIPAFYSIPTKLSFIGFECEKGHIKWGEREVCADVSNFPLAEFEFATFLKCRLANSFYYFIQNTNISLLCVIICIYSLLHVQYFPSGCVFRWQICVICSLWF